MNKFLSAAVIALIASPAMAADLGGHSMKDDAVPYSEGPIVNWSGFYVGVQGGYGNANHKLTPQEYRDNTVCIADNGCNTNGSAFTSTTGTAAIANGGVVEKGTSIDQGTIDGINSHGGIGGGRVGYDLARGRFLVGVFAGYDVSNMQTDVSIPGLGAVSLEKQDEWMIGGRIGFIAAPRTMIYALAAYDQTKYDIKGLSFETGDKESVKTSATYSGISVGGGMEFALTQNVFLGAEYTHTFYGAENIFDDHFDCSNLSTTKGFGTRVRDDLDEDKIMATLKIKLNGNLFDR